LKAALPDAPRILLRNVNGLFVRVERGTWLSDWGRAALVRWAEHIAFPAAQKPAVASA